MQLGAVQTTVRIIPIQCQATKVCYAGYPRSFLWLVYKVDDWHVQPDTFIYIVPQSNMAVLMESRRQVSTGCSHLFRNRLGLLCLLLISLLQFQRTYAWDNTDFELFDLVEEVPQNFYELLGLDQVG